MSAGPSADTRKSLRVFGAHWMDRLTRRLGPLVRQAGLGADFVAAPKQNPWCAMELTPKQALELWHGVSVAALKREQPHLSARQFADLAGQAAGRL